MGCDLRCGYVGRGDGEVVWTGRLSELGFMGLVGWAMNCAADMLGAGMGRLFGLGLGELGDKQDCERAASQFSVSLCGPVWKTACLGVAGLDRRWGASFWRGNAPANFLPPFIYLCSKQHDDLMQGQYRVKIQRRQVSGPSLQLP